MRPRRLRGAEWLLAVMMSGALAAPLIAQPFIPTDDAQILAQLPAGARHADVAARRLAVDRLDVSVLLARFYIEQARASGDLRYLGYAQAVLAPWVAKATAVPAALVLQATLQQSRHEFAAALATLDRTLAARAEDAQAWLTRATILRVVGRYGEAKSACAEFARRSDAALGVICEQSVEGLAGHLETAYRTLTAAPSEGLLGPERAWRESELGEMAVRLGRDSEAEQHFQRALVLDARDFYVRAAYADLLLRQRRYREVAALLAEQQSIEPLLLRLAIAQKQLGDPAFGHSRELLQAAFAAEAQRGEAVHRREQARFLLEVENRPLDALAAAVSNWAVQREPDDALVLVCAAHAAGQPRQAQAVLEFARSQGLQDVRLDGAAATHS
jgi:tetratricopeptide (TPR) repeat protein